MTSKRGNKTVPTENSVERYLDDLDDERTIADCRRLVAMMERATGEPPVMWGHGIVGFGQYHYRYDSGREGDSFLTGFAARKSGLSIYIMPGFEPFEALLKQLGKHRTGKSCLYIKSLDAVDEHVLEQLVTDSVVLMRQRYPG